MQADTNSDLPSKGFLRSALDAMLIPFLAILTAVVLGGIIIAVVRGNPFLAYYGLIQGSFGSAKALSETAVWATPYIFAGLAVALAFKFIGGLPICARNLCQFTRRDMAFLVRFGLHNRFYFFNK